MDFTDRFFQAQYFFDVLLSEHFNEGMFTIFSIQSDDVDNYYTSWRGLNAEVYNLSIGGFYAIEY
jgi:hypothetical protein